MKLENKTYKKFSIKTESKHMNKSCKMMKLDFKNLIINYFAKFKIILK